MKIKFFKEFAVLVSALTLLNPCSNVLANTSSAEEFSEAASTIYPSMNAVIRLESKAIAKLKLHGLSDEMRLLVKDTYSNTFVNPSLRGGEYLYFNQLQLDADYVVYLIHDNGTEQLVARINTGLEEDEVIYVSERFTKSLGWWTESNPEERLTVLQYLQTETTLDIIERVAFLQRFYYDDQFFEDNFEDWLNENAEWTGEEGGDIDENDLPDLWDESNPDPCRCKYILNIKRDIRPGNVDPIGKRHLPFALDDSREYFGAGPNVYSHYNHSENGPAKKLGFTLKVDKFGHGEEKRTKGTLSSGAAAGANKSQLYWLLLCDKTQTGQALPENCACSKKLTLSYRYDVQLKTIAEKISCALCNTKGAAATAEDWATVVLQQGSKETVLKVAKASSSSSCEGVGPIGHVAGAVDFANKVAKVLYPVVPSGGSGGTTGTGGISAAKITSLAAAFQSGAVFFNTPSGSCGQTSQDFVLFDGSTTVDLKANEPVTITMMSAHEQQASAKRAGQAWARIHSDYYLAGTITTNLTQTEKNYCCMKKVGAFNIGAYDVAPNTTKEVQDLLGVELDKVGPWDHPYDVPNPAVWNGILVPFEVDLLYGESGCDKVIIKTNLPSEEKSVVYLHNLILVTNPDGSLRVEGNEERQLTNYKIYNSRGQLLDFGQFDTPFAKFPTSHLNLHQGFNVLHLFNEETKDFRTIKFYKP